VASNAFFYQSNVSRGILRAPRHLAGWMARHGCPGENMWEVHKADYQPGGVREKLTRGRSNYARFGKSPQRMTDRPVEVRFTICAMAIDHAVERVYDDDKR